MTNQPELLDTGVTACLRCGAKCRRGTPDPNARALVQSAKEGFCPNCAITKFLLSIEPLVMLFEGTPARGNIPARPGRGPEIFLDGSWREQALRPVMRGVVAHTQLPESAINWIEVVGNWGLPWPKGKGPELGASF